DPAVAKERPVAPGVLDEGRVARRHQDIWRRARFRDDAAKGVAHERMTEELETVGAWLALVAHPVGGGDIHAVGDGVSALNRPPCLDLRASELTLLRRMPADRRRVEQHLGAEETR